MKWLRSLSLAATALAFAAPALASRPPPPWWRPQVMPEHFSFVGEITPTVLRDGVAVDAGNEIPDSWLGGQIRGTLVLNTNFAEGGQTIDGVVWDDGNPEFGRAGNWFSLSITNPDGSSFTMPNVPMGPGISGHLRAGTGWADPDGGARQTLALDRTFSDGALEQAFHLDLAGILGNWLELPPLIAFGDPWNSSPGLSQLQVNADFATFTNAGSVSQSGLGDSFSYGFRLTRFVHLPPVPEPETWAMLLAGLGILVAAVRRRMPQGVGQHRPGLAAATPT